MLNVNQFIIRSKIYGPFERLVVWFQGCSLHCPGCINPDMWSFEKKLNEMSCDDIINLIIENKLEGITLLGGEPLQQVDIGILIRKLNAKNIGIVLFTGYEYEELNSEQKELVELCDLVISGRYDQSLRNTSLYLRGSTNQKLLYNTDRYKEFNTVDKKQIEISINKDYTELRGIIYGNELLKILNNEEIN